MRSHTRNGAVAGGVLLLLALLGCAGDRRMESAPAPRTLPAVILADAPLVPRVVTRERVTTPASLLAAPPVPRDALLRLARLRAMLAEGIRARSSGEATFYSDRFEGRATASGILFRQSELWAAHRFYPFGTRLRVTNLRNSRSVEVRVVDRGPFGDTAARRNTIIDVSRTAARQLGFVSAGRAPVRVDVLQWGTGDQWE